MVLAYFGLNGLFTAVAYGCCGAPAAGLQRRAVRVAELFDCLVHSIVQVCISWIGMGAIHLVAAVATPPAKYPDLITYMFICFSAGHFVLTWLVIVWIQMTGRFEAKSHTE